ncbi:hypothetical protein Vadar_033735 [Vaccinium darrowii]|uniref:Uncharacterized protein n=1 Tax=Vaccinium darrowii TaxID=229202 RepID=A0ACB7XV82_9ERIC|nr:hypothetical protein Vadar_033735 [Vaccinium darrowii]
MWTSISNIDLRDYKEDTSFLDFVDRVLFLHDASDIKSLRLQSAVDVNSSRVNSWISASIRHNIEELNLTLKWKTQPVLPCCLFTCQSLVVLKLSMEWPLKVPSLIQFSNLKTLELSEVTFSDDNSTQYLFSSCPVLQELALVNCGWENLKTITIFIPTLKRLTIDGIQDPEGVLSCVTEVYAPNLIHLDCTYCMRVDFRIYGLSSVVEASICINEPIPDRVVIPRVLRLLNGIFNVKKLSIATATLEYLTVFKSLLGLLPTFYNMTHLVLDGQIYDDSFRVLIDLLEKSPNLESLTLEQINEYFDEADWMWGRVPSCFTSSLKTVHMDFFVKGAEETRLVRFLLEHATVLERFTFHSLSGELKSRKVLRRLNKLPRGSKGCVIVDLLPI